MRASPDARASRLNDLEREDGYEKKGRAMQTYDVTVHPESERLPREAQLAWKIAKIASDPVEVSADVTEMIINRIIDNAAVAIASLNRHPVMTARGQALAHPREGGAAVFGLP